MSWFSLAVESKTEENKNQWRGKGDGEILHTWFPQPLFWLSGMGIFVIWGIVTYQQYFSGFFQFSFPEISGFQRKAASANKALAAEPVPVGGLLSLLGAFHTWPFLYKGCSRSIAGPKILLCMLQHTPDSPTRASLAVPASRQLPGQWQGRGAGTGVAMGTVPAGTAAWHGRLSAAASRIFFILPVPVGEEMCFS